MQAFKDPVFTKQSDTKNRYVNAIFSLGHYNNNIVCVLSLFIHTYF